MLKLAGTFLTVRNLIGIDAFITMAQQSPFSPAIARQCRQAAWLPVLFLLFCSGCAAPPKATKVLETTAYCNCSICCNWERGSWKYLKLDFWNRYISSGSKAGAYYSGLTASGTVPYSPEEGLFSLDSVHHPWMIPLRLILFPWHLLPHDGTIAADTRYYPFGTRMHVPGYGWGRVEDRGGKIKGPDRIDLYFDSHGEAMVWGRRKLPVAIEYSR